MQRLCDRVALLEDGTVRALDTPAGLVAGTAAPVVVTFALADPPDGLERLPGLAWVRRNGSQVEVSGTDETAWALLERLHGSGRQPERLRISARTLDDAYLELVGRPGAAGEPVTEEAR